MLRLNNIKLADGRSISGIEVYDGKDSVEEKNMGAYNAFPGFFDSHIHGAFGYDVSDGRAEDVVKLASLLPSFGVSDFLPTLMTIDEEKILRAAGAVAEAKTKLSEADFSYANIAGLRLEGPFLSPLKAGVQSQDNLVTAEKFTDIIGKIENDYPGLLKMIDIAPELDGAMDLVKELKGRYVISLAHSDCDYKMADEFFKTGGTSLTHALNAMRPCLKRDPGPLGAAFDNGDTFIEVICDGIHVDPSVLRMLFKLFDGRIIVISDAMRAAGMPDGVYDLGGTPVESKGGRTYFGSNGNLAGSVTNLAQEAERLFSYGISKELIAKALTETPRKRMKVNNSGRSGGLTEDIVFLDDEMRLMCMISRGRLVSPYFML